MDAVLRHSVLANNYHIIYNTLLYNIYYSFIHSGYSIAPLQVHHYIEALPTQHGYCVEFDGEAPQTTESEGLAQSPCVAARAGFKPSTLRTRGDESTSEIHTPLCVN